MNMALDHITLGAVSLEEGAAYLRTVLAALGVAFLVTVEQDVAGPLMAFVLRLPDGGLRTLA
jgi:hypothetical protein